METRLELSHKWAFGALLSETSELGLGARVVVISTGRDAKEALRTKVQLSIGSSHG